MRWARMAASSGASAPEFLHLLENRQRRVGLAGLDVAHDPMEDGAARPRTAGHGFRRFLVLIAAAAAAGRGRRGDAGHHRHMNRFVMAADLLGRTPHRQPIDAVGDGKIAIDGKARR